MRISDWSSDVCSSDLLDAVHDVAPLVGAAHLQAAVVAPAQLQEVVGLEDHVVELQEGQRMLALQAQLHAVEGQHAVDGEVAADVAQEIDVLQAVEPVRIVDRKSTRLNSSH